MTAPAIEVDIAKAGALGNRFIAELCELREVDPIHGSEASQCWLITRHADVADALLGALHVLIVAGHDTTSNTLTLGLESLARHPDLWDYLYRHPEEALDVSLELMRYIAMSTSQPRIVQSDFEWHGKRLKRGDVAFLMLAAANRDPRVFDRPETIDPHRNLEESMVFAPGLHHCIGHLLAKMQVSEFFSALVQRFEGLQMLDERLHFMPQVAFRGVYALNVSLKRRSS